MTEYRTPTSVGEALQTLLSYRGAARVVAGGTDVLPDLRRGRIEPRCLVDVTRIPGLDRITAAEGWVEVGAAVTFAQLSAHPLLRERVPALVDAAHSVGAAPIQNAATWVGNIVQAMPAADGAVVAIALEAEARLVDRHGARWEPVESLFQGPGLSAVDPTCQLVTALRFPLLPRAWGTGWRRVGRRPSLVLPILNCAVTLGLEGGRIRRATIALGPVAPRPFRARAAEAFLRGQSPTNQVLAEAGRLAREAANPRSSRTRASRAYRLSIIPPLIEEGLAQAAERASRRLTEEEADDDYAGDLGLSPAADVEPGAV